MSKRYGRNQKRAHRTRIAELERHIADLQKHHDQLWRVNRDLVNEIDCAKKIVGEYCVAFNPRGMTMAIGQSQFVEVMQHDKDFNTGAYRYWDIHPREMLAPINIHRIRLPILCVLADREHIRGSRHMKVIYEGKAWGYAIDPMAWRMSRYPRELCRNIADQVVGLIYEEMSKDMTVRAELRRTHTRDEIEPRISAPRFEFPGLPDFLKGN